MTILDWTLVVGLNGAIIVYGLFLGRETKSSSDWFLAGRSLPTTRTTCASAGG